MSPLTKLNYGIVRFISILPKSRSDLQRFWQEQGCLPFLSGLFGLFVGGSGMEARKWHCQPPLHRYSWMVRRLVHDCRHDWSWRHAHAQGDAAHSSKANSKEIVRTCPTFRNQHSEYSTYNIGLHSILTKDFNHRVKSTYQDVSPACHRCRDSQRSVRPYYARRVMVCVNECSCVHQES